MYNEEDDDECKITFQTTNSNLPDLNNLLPNKTLKVQWGYIGEAKSQTRKISIRDIRMTYGPDKIELTYIRKVKSQEQETTSIIDWINEISKQNEFDARFIVGRKILNVKTGAYVDDKASANIITAIDETFVQTYFLDTRLITPGNSTFTGHLQDELDKAPDGPWFQDGRDCTLNIITRNFEQKPSYVYSYQDTDSDVISINIETNNKLTDTKNTRSAEFSRETKDMLINDDILTPNYSAGDQSREARESRGAAKNLLALYKNKSTINDPVTMRQAGIHKVFINTASPVATDPGSNNLQTAIDNTAVNISYEITPFQLAVNGHIEDQIENQIDNDMKEQEQKRIEATIELIGDPTIKVSKTIRLKNISPYFAGIWYIKKSRHILQPGKGFTTVLEVLKKPLEMSKARARVKKIFSETHNIANENFAVTTDDGHIVYPGNTLVDDDPNAEPETDETKKLKIIEQNADEAIAPIILEGLNDLDAMRGIDPDFKPSQEEDADDFEGI